VAWRLPFLLMMKLREGAQRKESITMNKLLSVCLLVAAVVVASAQGRNDYFKITVVDEETGRGVPLVELKMTSEAAYYADSNGIVAFYEPGLMGQEIYFHVNSHGYEYPADGLGQRGVALKVTPGGSATIRLKRLNIAERLYRITGEGIYRDSALTGHPIPLKRPLLNGQVTGQDAGHAIPYRGKLYWFWGDTNRLSYPLGNFASSGATSDLPGQGGLDPNLGIDLDYFVNEAGFSRPMAPASAIPGPGLKWIFWMMTVQDEQGRERLLAQYERMGKQGKADERGLVIFNDQTESFEKLAQFDLNLPLHPNGRPFRVNVNGETYYYFAVLYPDSAFVRVKADLRSLTDQRAYEAFTCLAPGSRYHKASSKLDRRADGRLIYAWKANTDPISYARERELIAAGRMQAREAWFQLQDVTTGAAVATYSGSVQWNEFRRRWVMIAQKNVGEIWFAEADTPVGPWVYARQIVSHDRYTFYLPTHHPIFDQQGGRVIFFEGTYTNLFSGNPEKTPRYDYNQIMYRLRLDDPRLALPAPVYAIEGTDGSPRYLMRDGVESQQLWERIEKIAFFAIPPERKSEGLIPIYAVTEARDSRLQREPPTSVSSSAQPLFYALPAAPADAQENISDKWLCKLKETDGSDLPFTLELKLEGERVSGTVEQGVITQGRFRSRKLELEVKTDQEVYLLTAQLRQRRLGGEWRIEGSDKRGDWSGEREVKPVSTAIVPLYEYRLVKDGARFYSTEPSLPGKAVKRAARPLCLVWRNPTSALLVDHRAKPVLIVNRKM
jgi:hypothetical protein